MEDREIIDKFVQGDKTGFDELVKRYQKLVFNVCMKMLADHEEALDVAQDVFVKLFESLKDFRHESQLSTYLYSITLNACRNRLRTISRHRKNEAFSLDDPIESAQGPIQRELASSDPTPKQNLDAKERQEILRKELYALEADYREIVVLKDIEGLKYDEIADILSMDIGTVKSRLSRARQALRERLEKILP